MTNIFIFTAWRAETITVKDINPDVEHQEKDISLSKNVVYAQVKHGKERISLQENVAYVSTTDYVSSNDDDIPTSSNLSYQSVLENLNGVDPFRMTNNMVYGKAGENIYDN